MTTETETTGEWAHASTTGYRASASTTGNRAHASTTGYRATASTTGNQAHASTTGDLAHASTTGDRASASTTGYRANASTTGDRASASTTGARAISVAVGTASWAMAGQEGSWIVLAAHEDEGIKVLTAQAGVDIEPGVWCTAGPNGIEQHPEILLPDDGRGHTLKYVDGNYQAGCRNFDIDQARAHWGNTDHPDRDAADRLLAAVEAHHAHLNSGEVSR